MSFYTAYARRLLFRLRPETAHEFTMSLLGLAASVLGKHRPHVPGRPVECFGMGFPNAVGLAAGMDKNGTALAAWPLMGFGFVEIGTVTALAQPGNPRPRLFRYPTQQALINRMGFNNDGAEAVAQRLARTKKAGCWPQVPVGINLGKSRVTPVGEAAGDYAESFRHLRDFGDYFVVNVSSPNTPGLRDLQVAGHLREILKALDAVNPAGKPVLVKLAPDLANDGIGELVAAGEACGAAGWIATNTTLDHSAVAAEGDETGGLSGAPLRARATQVVKLVADHAQRPVIGVGGVDGPDAAREKLTAGADLIQLYTGLVYEGPGLPHRIVAALAGG